MTHDEKVFKLAFVFFLKSYKKKPVDILMISFLSVGIYKWMSNLK